MIPASDWWNQQPWWHRLEHLIAYCLSYNIRCSAKTKLRRRNMKDGNVESFQKKSCPIENTRKPWCFHQNEKRGYCIELSQLKHIKRWKSINIYRDTINFPKIWWRHNMQIEILSSEAIMMTSWVNWGSNETWNHISDSYFIKICKKKNWGHLAS